MKDSCLKNKLIDSIKRIYAKLVFINDTPHKVALGLGLGVFAGIMPGMGILAALFLAFVFRANRASALLGSMLTNTWLSIVTFLLSIKAGSAIMKLDWYQVYKNYRFFLKNFQWADLFKASIFKLVLPLVIGYIAISLALGLAVYFISYAIIKVIKNARKS